jgi:hypothetical protein
VGSSGSSGSTSGSADAGIAGCSDLVEIGPHLSFVTTQAAPPTPAGGVIMDGTWATSSLVAYDPSQPSGSPYNDWPGETYRFRGHAYDQVVGSTPDEYPTRESGTFTTSGNEISLTPTCAALGPSNAGPLRQTSPSAPRTMKYTATAAKLTLFGPFGNAKVVEDYAKH